MQTKQCGETSEILAEKTCPVVIWSTPKSWPETQPETPQSGTDSVYVIHIYIQFLPHRKQSPYQF
jgi:hypothetical protein